MIRNSGLAIAGAFLPIKSISKGFSLAKDNFSFCLNTSTIREQNLGLMGEIELAARAGYDGIEIWVRTLQDFADKGGKLSVVKKRASELGISIENAISFPKWIVDDDSVRQKALIQAQEEMEMLAEIGCKRIAAPPVGATDQPGLDLDTAAQRYYD